MLCACVYLHEAAECRKWGQERVQWEASLLSGPISEQWKLLFSINYSFSDYTRDEGRGGEQEKDKHYF